MHPIYKFQLSAGSSTVQAFPTFKDDLSIEYALEHGQEFYRGKLSGKLTFLKDDYRFIRSRAFDTRFDVLISISYDGGQLWAAYWSGQFWKTDCQFNDDDQTAVVTPSLKDRYNAVLDGMEKEYNLIDLAPAIEPVNLDKRPCLQIYVDGNKSVGQTIFGNNIYWETECQQPENITEYQFGAILDLYPIRLGFYDMYPPAQERLLYSAYPLLGTSTINYGDYIVEIVEITGGYDVTLTRTSDNAKWRNSAAPQYSLAELDAVSGTPADYQHVELSTLQSVHIYGRIITDVVTAWEIPANDIVDNNRNYRYCIPFDGPNNALVVITDKKSGTATPYGLYQPGLYYDVPNTTGHWIPIAQNSWGEVSIWLNADEFATLDISISSYLATVTLKDAYPIWSVIASLLGKIAPNISHVGTTDYSRFLYDNNPVTHIDQRLFIAPKSNVISSGYDQPAQKAPITLKRVTDMLRDCFRCYWFIDGQNRFRIEHISYFMNGGAYPGTPNFPVVGVDLTQRFVPRNGKSWAYARNQYEFDKPEMAARYQFGWMDDVTEPFDGFPIEILSSYVKQDNIEQIDVSQFTSDVDYILLNPGSISKDGFVLLAAQLTEGSDIFKLPYVHFSIKDTDYILQNGWAAFMFLQRYYLYDMPAHRVQVNGSEVWAPGIKKLKTQSIKFPLLREPDLYNLVKTELGDGTIQKLSVNLLSRTANATLKYDTE